MTPEQLAAIAARHAAAKCIPIPLWSVPDIVQVEKDRADLLAHVEEQAKELEQMRKAFENVGWLLGQELTDEAMRHLKDYVARKIPEFHKGAALP